MTPEENIKNLIDKDEKRISSSRPLFAPKIEYIPGGGVLTWYEGYKYPVHGLLTDEALWATEMLKKHIISDLYVISGAPQRYFLIVLLPFFKRIAKRWLFQFGRYADTVVKRYIKVELLSPAVAEFHRVATKLWGNSEEAVWIILGFCAILEYDKGYRWPWQDIMMAANRWELINNPAREMTRLIQLYLKREHRPEYRHLGFPIKLFLWSRPEIRQMISDFAREADFEKFRLDRYDLWGCLRNTNYDYDDRGLEERREILKKL